MYKMKRNVIDKYDRDPWHDAETVPMWLFYTIIVVGVLCLIFL